MLGFLRTASSNSLESREIGAESQIPLAMAQSISDAIMQIARNETPKTAGLPTNIVHALEDLSASVTKRNEVDLARAVGFSSSASEGVAGVARVVGQVRRIDGMAHSMSAAIAELDASLHGIAEIGATTADSMTTATTLMSEGARAVEGAGHSIDAIAGATGTMEKSVTDLENAANQIGGIVATIEAIASQTNLLALNATIEAARAGEAGKGFAVVAGEVKALSAQTRKATENIQLRISKLQSDVAALVKAMQAANAEIQAGRSVTLDASSKISSLDGIFNENSSRMNEVSRILSEQAAATRELATGVTNIASRVSTTNGYAEQAIRSVASGEQLVNSLLTELETYGVPDYVLHRAKSDHLLWKKRLNEMLIGLNKLTAAELTDHFSCRLGKWYKHVTDPQVRNHAAFAQLESPHRAVHTHGKRAAELYGKGELDQACAEVADMEKASDDVVRLLDALIARR